MKEITLKIQQALNLCDKVHGKEKGIFNSAQHTVEQAQIGRASLVQGGQTEILNRVTRVSLTEKATSE